MSSGHGLVVVIGVGNPFRHDDGFGEAVTEALRARLASTARQGAGAEGRRIELCCLDGEPTRLLDAWGGAALAVIVDAMWSGIEPGTVERVEIDPRSSGDADRLPRPVGPASTHAAGVGDALALGRALDRLPDRLVIYAVEGLDFSPGPGLSPPVREALDAVVTRLAEELAS